jgi:hypothetical protein
MADARQVQADDFGTLLEMPSLPGEDELLRLVRVTNGTPEPDGSYRDYVLRVPPTMASAHDAVAWTFDVAPETYHPAAQS